MTTKMPARRAFSAAFSLITCSCIQTAGNFQLDGLIHDFFHILWAAENIYDVNLLRDFQQRRVGLLPQGPMYPRIHRNDSVALRLHVRRHSMAGTQRAIRESDHCDRFGAFQQVRDRVCLRK